MTDQTSSIARATTNVLNPFVVFTALYALVALAKAGARDTALYVALEILAAVVVAGYVFMMRRRRRVGNFWISARAERLIPSLVLLATFVALLAMLALLEATRDLFLLTLSMGLASATVAAVTLLWKASAHCTVAGHAAAAGLLLLGPLSILFLLSLPLVIWSRVVLKAHTLTQALAGAAAGVAFAVLFLT